MHEANFQNFRRQKVGNKTRKINHMNNEPRNHHYNPQFILRNWSVDKNKIWKTKNITKKEYTEIETRKVSIKYTASEEDLYSIKKEYRNDSIIKFFVRYLCIKHKKEIIKNLNLEESVFSKIDSDGAKAFKEIFGTKTEYPGNLSAIHHYDFIKYIALLQARNPKILKTIENEMNNALRKGSFMYNYLSNHFQEKEIDDLFINLKKDNNLSTMALLDNCLDSSLLELIDKINFIIVKISENDNSFITSDYPYVTFPNIKNKKALHVLPYSSKECIVMSHNREIIDSILKIKNQYIEKEKSIVDLLNFMISASSTEIYTIDEKTGKDMGKYIDLIEKDINKSKETFRNLLDKVFDGV